MKQIFKNLTMPPPVLNILIVVFICAHNAAFSQIKKDAVFHRHRVHSRPETFRVDRIEYRKSDNAIVGIYGLPEYAKGFTPEEKAWGYIEKNAYRFGIKVEPRSVLRHHFTRNGRTQSVVRYRQFYKGMPVDENEIVITINKKGEVVFVINNTKPIHQDLNAAPRTSEQTALRRALAYFSLRDAPEGIKINKVFHFSENRFLLCYRVSFMLSNPRGVWMVYVDAQSGKVAEVYDAAHYQCALSGNGNGNVFMPDPISTSGAVYGTGGFSHNNDANHADLDAQLRAVNFPVGNPFTGPTYLVGEYAVDTDLECTGSGTNWNYNRSHDCFEEVMCYYHISQNMCYYKNELDGLPPFHFSNTNYPNAARFYVGQGSSLYDVTSGTLYIGTYTDDNNATIEAGEDAAVIIHELGHGINNWMTGSDLSTAEGLGEGFADYWAQSYIRRFGLWNEFEAEYQWVSRWYFFTDELPDEHDRTTDFIVPYNQLPAEPHAAGQLFATALMRIWDDIGKLKTDLIALWGMSMTDGQTRQSMAAEAIYQTAVDNEYTTEELCIIYRHFKDIYGADFDPQQPDGLEDYYMRDTADDFGEEPNTTAAPIWLTRDIWVRQQNDGEAIREHQNPKYGQTNYIYVRLRSRNCQPVTDGELWVYFSKASTWLAWPQYWIDYYEPTSNGPVLAGDIVPGAPFAIPEDLQAGDEKIIEIPWTNMPDPEDFDTERHHFCLLARIVSTQDPIGTEVQEVGQNVRNFNNIVWKNLTILEKDEFTDPSGTVYLRVPARGPVDLIVNTPESFVTVPCPSQGTVRIHLEEDLYTQWENNGEHGEGFAGDSPGVFRWIAETMRIDEVTIPDTLSHALVVTFDPDSAAVACAFDVIQLDSLDAVVGGERFVYEPLETESFSAAPMERTQQEIHLPPFGPRISIFPVPVRDMLQVNVEGLDENIRETLFVHVNDALGKLWLLQNMPEPDKGRSTARLNIEALPAGLYYLRVALPGRNIQTVRFIKI